MSLADWVVYGYRAVNIHIKPDLSLDAHHQSLPPGKLIVTQSPSPLLHRATDEREKHPHRCEQVNAGACEGRERGSAPLELELQVTVRHLKQALGTELGSHAKVV